jgi:nitric oxide reductase NorD protein
MEGHEAGQDGAVKGPERGWSFYTYDEWDFRRERFRRNWCTIKEMELSATRGNFYENTMRAYRGQLTLLRRQFEFLRQEYRFLKRQKDGEDVDLDALVEAYVDLRAFGRASDYLFIRQLKDRRDLAVSFLVDMSASTEGWVSTAIKESLILLCEALTSLGDRYAIFGFSGMRRTGCHFFRIKDFGQEYDRTVKERINTIGPRDYTRMGAAIRHASFLLRQQEARVRLLMIISDGKPEDYDEYKGPYAIEDTRMAVIEAREQAINPFCITIDKQGREYLPRIFGQKNYVVIPDPALLHKRIPEMYRILTG